MTTIRCACARVFAALCLLAGGGCSVLDRMDPAELDSALRRREPADDRAAPPHAPSRDVVWFGDEAEPISALPEFERTLLPPGAEFDAPADEYLRSPSLDGRPVFVRAAAETPAMPPTPMPGGAAAPTPMPGAAAPDGAAPGAPPDAAKPAAPPDPYAHLHILPSFRQTVWRDLKHLPLEFWDDTKNVFFRPVPLIILVGSVGAVIPSYKYADPKVRAYYGDNENRYPHTPSHQVRDTADFLGAPEHHAIAAAACYLASIPIGDEKFYDFSKSLLIALGLNDATVGVLKLSVHDRSPNGKRFGFPSGHTSSTFAFASVVHDYYGPLVAAPFYATGVFTGWGRLWDKEHRFTDVWYGAVIGLVIGHSVGLRHSMRFMDMQVTPTAEVAAGGAQFGLQFSKRF